MNTLSFQQDSNILIHLIVLSVCVFKSIVYKI